LNLAGKANKGLIDCYSPGKVVKARKYQEEKEKLRIAEEAKLQRKIQRAANTLRNKQKKARKAAEREAKAAQKRDLELAKKSAKKASKKKPVSMAPKAKKTAPIVSTKQRAPNKTSCSVKVIV